MVKLKPFNFEKWYRGRYLSTIYRELEKRDLLAAVNACEKHFMDQIKKPPRQEKDWRIMNEKL